ncbi:S-methyl-5-thioribose-1-phosphate isomerase [bacterium]|nr:S-methyl-5-thioribose-1-phosphate isomerase [bacterium]
MRTVTWLDGVVRMIDQKQIPWEFAEVDLLTVDAVAGAIADMTVRGAPAIGAAAAFGMALAAHSSQAEGLDTLRGELQAAANKLKAARPTAVNLAWAVDRLMALAQRDTWSGPAMLRDAMLHEAQRIADEDIDINRRMGAHGAALIEDGMTVLHHCNTGALATVDYGTALGVIRAAYEQGKHFHVLLDETRPRLQGSRLSAWELDRLGVPYDIIADTAAGYYMKTGEVNLVLVGADRVAANGDFANKIGTYQLAILAKEHGIPFYAVAPMSTVDRSLAHGDLIPIEQRDPDEVRAPYGHMLVPEHFHARNPAFDVTPARYLTGLVTEHGIVKPPLEAGLAAILGQEGG